MISVVRYFHDVYTLPQLKRKSTLDTSDLVAKIRCIASRAWHSIKLIFNPWYHAECKKQFCVKQMNKCQSQEGRKTLDKSDHSSLPEPKGVIAPKAAKNIVEKAAKEVLNNPILPKLDLSSRLAKPISIDFAKKEQFLAEINSEPHRKVLRKVIENYITHISMDQFLESLKISVNSLNQSFRKLPEDSNITLVTVPGKSQSWVAGLALKYMERSPNKHLEMELNGGFLSSSEKLIIGDRQNIIIFDDCSYSGTQIHNMLHSIYSDSRTFMGIDQWRSPDFIRKLAEDNPLTEENCKNFYFVIPYMTSIAKKKFFRMMKIFQKNVPYVRINLITVNEISSISKLPLSKDDKSKLSDLKMYNKFLSFVYTDWKKPDFMSMPHRFATGTVPKPFRRSEKEQSFCFIPEIDKPY